MVTMDHFTKRHVSALRSSLRDAIRVCVSQYHIAVISAVSNCEVNISLSKLWSAQEVRSYLSHTYYQIEKHSGWIQNQVWRRTSGFSRDPSSVWHNERQFSLSFWSTCAWCTPVAGRYHGTLQPIACLPGANFSCILIRHESSFRHVRCVDTLCSDKTQSQKSNLLQLRLMPNTLY